MESKYLLFIEQQAKKDAKTKVFFLHPKMNPQIKLGEVKWFGAFRKYAFFPEGGTIYDQDCLNDIFRFLNKLMLERTIEKQQQKENNK